MSIGLPILAEGGEDPTVKIIIGVVVAAFGVIGQIIGAITKKPDKSLPPSKPRARPTVALPAPMQQRTEMRPVEVTQQVRQRPPQIRQPKQQMPKQQARRQPPPIRRQAVQPVAASLPINRQPVVARSNEVVAPAAAKGMPQRDMIEALLKPKNLRKAYMLTELLQPPVALRPDHDRFRDPG